MRAGFGVILLTLLAACGTRKESAHAPEREPARAAPASPFVVAIVVDQLSAWVASERLPELPAAGGFARLRREGTWVRSLRYPYAVTDTAPGHSALHTGRVPAESGVFGNEVPGPLGGVPRVSILRDETVRVVGPAGTREGSAGVGSSASRLKVDTVADRLRAAHPEALVVSVSVKDRGAILPGGRHPSHVLWFDSNYDSFVTSTAFEGAFPGWARGVGDGQAVRAARAKPWELTDASWVAAHALTPDQQAGEGDLEGLGATFPHVGKTGNAFRGMPASDAMTAALALAAIAAEYDPGRPTLLLLSFSATDVIGHVFGPDSWEAWDSLRKLDDVLSTLIEALDRRTGAKVSVMLAADHGNVSMPEAPPHVPCAGDPYDRPCGGGVRLEPTPLRDELRVAAKAILGDGAWIDGLADPYLFLTPAARALPDPRRTMLDAMIRRTLGKHAGIDRILDARNLAAECPAVLAGAAGALERAGATEDLLVLVCRSWSPGAGDYYLTTRRGSFFDGELAVGKGTSHGTPHLYDRTVSMLVRAPGVVDAGMVVDEPVDFSVFAELEASLVHLDTRSPRAILSAQRTRIRP